MQTLHNLCLGNSYMYKIKNHMLAWKKADGTRGMVEEAFAYMSRS